MRAIEPVLATAAIFGCAHANTPAPTDVSEARRAGPVLRSPAPDLSCLENGKTRIEGVGVEDAKAITIVVDDATASQPIISIVRHDGHVQVRTGSNCDGELSGSGSEFALERRDGQWVITRACEVDFVGCRIAVSPAVAERHTHLLEGNRAATLPAAPPPRRGG